MAGACSPDSQTFHLPVEKECPKESLQSNFSRLVKSSEIKPVLVSLTPLACSVDALFLQAENLTTAN